MTSTLTWGIRSGLALLLVMSLVYSPGTSFPFIVSKAIYARVLIELIGVAWLLLALRTNKYRPANSWVLWLLGFNLAVMFAASIIGVSFTRSIWSNYERMLGVWDVAHWTLLAVIAGSFIISARDWRVFLSLNLGVTSAVSILAITQTFGMEWLPYIVAECRVSSTLGNPSFLAALLMVAILIAAGLLAHSFVSDSEQGSDEPVTSRFWNSSTQRWALRTFWMLSALLGLWVMFLTGTRGALIGLIIGATAAPIALGLRGNRQALRPVIMASGGVLIAVVLFAVVDLTVGLHVRSECDGQSVIQRMVGTSSSASEPGSEPGSVPEAPQVEGLPVSTASGVSSPSLDTRIAAAQWGMKAFLDHPIFGVGPENFLAAFGRYVQPSILSHTDRPFDQAHNKLVETLATSGFVGLASYLAVWAALVWAILRRRRPLSEEIVAYTILGALTGYFVQNLFLFDTPSMLLQWTVLTAWVVSDEIREARSESKVTPIDADHIDVDIQNSLIPRAIVIPVSGVLVVLAVLSIFYLNYRPLTANRTFVQAFKEPTVPGILAVAGESFDTYPNLANRSRRHLFRQLSTSWNQFSVTDRQMALDFVIDQSAIGIDVEPQNILLVNATIEFLHVVAPDAPAVLDRAEQLLALAQIIAPDYVQTHQLIATQALLRGQYDEAIRVSQEYIARSPDAERFFIQVVESALFLQGLEQR